MTNGDWVTIGARLLVAALVGLALGFEREWRGRDAGLRTHALVATSSATITISALLLAHDVQQAGGDSDPVRVVQGLAQAIGFIAGGLIFVRGGDVRNMTTAASLWMAAAIGIAAGAGQFALAVLSAAIALLVMVGGGLSRRPASAEPSPDGEDGLAQPSSRRGPTIIDQTPSPRD